MPLQPALAALLAISLPGPRPGGSLIGLARAAPFPSLSSPSSSSSSPAGSSLGDLVRRALELGSLLSARSPPPADGGGGGGGGNSGSSIGVRAASAALGNLIARLDDDKAATETKGKADTSAAASGAASSASASASGSVNSTGNSTSSGDSDSGGGVSKTTIWIVVVVGVVLLALVGAFLFWKHFKKVQAEKQAERAQGPDVDSDPQRGNSKTISEEEEEYPSDGNTAEERNQGGADGDSQFGSDQDTVVSDDDDGYKASGAKAAVVTDDEDDENDEDAGKAGKAGKTEKAKKAGGGKRANVNPDGQKKHRRRKESL